MATTTTTIRRRHLGCRRRGGPSSSSAMTTATRMGSHLLFLFFCNALASRCDVATAPATIEKNLPPPPTPNFTAGRRRRRRGLSSHLAERSPKMASSMDLLISPYYVPCIWKRSNTRLAFHSVCAAPRPPRRHHRFAAPEVPDVGKECAG